MRVHHNGRAQHIRGWVDQLHTDSHHMCVILMYAYLICEEAVQLYKSGLPLLYIAKEELPSPQHQDTNLRDEREREVETERGSFRAPYHTHLWGPFTSPHRTVTPSSPLPVSGAAHPEGCPHYCCCCCCAAGEANDAAAMQIWVRRRPEHW